MRIRAQVVGVVLVVLGAEAMLGWLLHLQILVRVLPDFAPMVFNTALSFVLSGIALSVSPAAGRYRPVVTVFGTVVVTVSTLTLCEHAFGWDLGIDAAWLHSWLPDVSPTPGRTSAGTASAFALGGTALFLSGRRDPARWRLLIRALTLGVGAVGALGIVGYALHARLLFPGYFFSGMAAHTAAGLVLFSLGLHLAWLQFEWGRVPLFAREDDQVTFAGALILASIALAGGIASFAILQDRVQTVVGDNVLNSLKRRIELIQDVLQLRDVNARIAATRPGVLRNLRLIQSGRDDGSNRANIEAVIANFLQQGFSALAYQDVKGNTIASGGTFVAMPAMAVTLQSPDRPQLLWGEGFVLRHRLPLEDATGPVGTVIAEQPLPILTRLAQNAFGIGATADMGLCVIREERLLCFPQRLNPQVFSAPLTDVSGEPLPMVRALRGETGVMITRDYRRQNVVAAFGPVNDLGLGIVVKIDAAEIFNPIREQLVLALVMLVLLVALGTTLLRMKVKPFATTLFDAKRTLQVRNIELARANEAKDRFLASMSHELRTPLNAIIGFTGTLLMKLPGPLNTAQEKQLKTVQGSARHLLSLINDLLDLVKVEAGKVELTLEPTVCQEVIEEAAASLRPQAEAKGLEFDLAMPESALTVHTDRRVLSQIVLNLANNAIKFTEKGRVTLSVEERIGGARKSIEISVLDTGVGIRQEDQERLFKEFAQIASSSPRQVGTGLGLHLSRKLADLLGAELTFQSEFGKGSVFTLKLKER